MSEILNIAGQTITVRRYHTVIVGAGASGMNCARRLYEYLDHASVENPQRQIAVVTAGLPLGASRMSGSDKQTYYKMGTSPETPDTAVSFAQSLKAAGCCHGDLALIEALGSLPAFYGLVDAGVPFPHDANGAYFGYKTDHDPFERATSAGPKTSKFMSEALEKIVRRYGITIYDHQETVDLIAIGQGPNRRILGILTLNRKSIHNTAPEFNFFYCDNLVLAAGGPGALYQTSVYPLGQTGMHGIALRAGLTAENLTETQFGLASTKFRWNVSGTYMQAIPRIYSIDSDGGRLHDFLADYFPSMDDLATSIFLKGYQWPFDPQRIENHQSSLIDILVYNETSQNRRVFMDFRQNPLGNDRMTEFRLQDLHPEALDYLTAAGAQQTLPIERLAHMNPLAIDLYREHQIDLYTQPLEIAVCAQHNNGGFSVNGWWESSIPHTFVIGEMAGTHGVKRPGGSALNAGQVGAQRAAEYIAAIYRDRSVSDLPIGPDTLQQIETSITRLNHLTAGRPSSAPTPAQAIMQIQQRMTSAAAHVRKLTTARQALTDAIRLYHQIQSTGMAIKENQDIITAIHAGHLALTSIAFLKAIVDLLQSGSGSRGSHLVISEDPAFGIVIHPNIKDPDRDTPLAFLPENTSLRHAIQQVKWDSSQEHLFSCHHISCREVVRHSEPFESIWRQYRERQIFRASAGES